MEAIKHSRHRFCLNFIVHQQEQGKFQKTKLRDSKGRKKKVETHVRRPKFGNLILPKKFCFNSFRYGCSCSPFKHLKGRLDPPVSDEKCM